MTAHPHLARLPGLAVTALLHTILTTGALASDPDSLWVATSRALLNIDNGGVSILNHATGSERLLALAVDELTGRAWTYFDNGMLGVYRPDGSPDTGQRLDAKGAAAMLAVDARSGAVWLAVDATVYRRQREGASLRAIAQFKHSIRALSIEPQSGMLWVGTRRQLVRLDRSGALHTELTFAGNDALRTNAYDPALEAVWVAQKEGLRLHEPDGKIRQQIALPKIDQLAPDGEGGLWAAAGKTLYRLDGSGLIAFAFEPFQAEPPKRIAALTVDRRDASVWVASQRSAKHIADDSRVLNTISLAVAKGSLQALALYSDTIAPALRVRAPLPNQAIGTPTPSVSLGYSDSGTGVDSDTLRFETDNGRTLDTLCSLGPAEAACELLAPLPEGPVTLRATISDRAGNRSAPAVLDFVVDTTAPELTIASPAEGLVTNRTEIDITGGVSEPATVRLNQDPVTLDLEGRFRRSVKLEQGDNTFRVEAVDQAGNGAVEVVRVVLDTMAPSTPKPETVDVGESSNGRVRMSAVPGTVQSDAHVAVVNLRTAQAAEVKVRGDGSFGLTIEAEPADMLQLRVTDAAGNSSGAVQLLVPNAAADLTRMAPALDRTVGTTVHASTAFLYSGQAPVQTGVTPTTIRPEHAAVVRGRVMRRDGSPLAGVQVSLSRRAEFGHSASRADGWFDIAVNGGGVLTVQYTKDGYLPVQRQVKVPWQDFATVEDVVMIPLDSQVSTIDLNSSAPVQVARGGLISDADGTRRSTVLFPRGTTATMIRADGSQQALTTLHVRATEYTVGPNGPQAMPGSLPPSSGYTYAVELSADEVLADGIKVAGKDLLFNQPVYNYVENFLGIAVGVAVPSGYYDPDAGAWRADRDGIVLAIVSVENGAAVVDTDGDGRPDDSDRLDALGFSRAERQALADLYEPGQTLWRMPHTHFSTKDYNFPVFFPSGARPSQGSAHRDGNNSPCQDIRSGSIIKCQSQIFGEAMPLAGTRHRLRYQSNRVVGRRSAYTYDIQLSGKTVPTALKAIKLEVFVAGRRFSDEFPAQPNLSYSFQWDGKDAYGRAVQGERKITVRIGFVYDLHYGAPPRLGGSGGRSFALPARVSGAAISLRRARMQGIQWTESVGLIGGFDSQQAFGLGGWGFEVLQQFHPETGTLYRGDGSRVELSPLRAVIKRVAGRASPCAPGGDEPAAKKACMRRVAGIAVAADGMLYVLHDGRTIRRVRPDATIEPVATLPRPMRKLVYGKDGKLYVGNVGEILRMRGDGSFEVVAGIGVAGTSGDGGPATQARIEAVGNFDVSADGSIYIGGQRSCGSGCGETHIRKVDPDGVITTIWRDRSSHSNRMEDIALGPNGSLYFGGAASYRVSKLSAEGEVTIVAGNGRQGRGGDGGLARQAPLWFPTRFRVTDDGTLYFVDFDRVRKVAPDGIITTVAGGGNLDVEAAEDGPAVYARIGPEVEALEVGPGGRVFIGENGHVRALVGAVSGFNGDVLRVASANARVLYEFDPSGRHIKTWDSITGAALYQFRYDANGWIVAIEDVNGDTTTIEREAAGAPYAIRAPEGQRSLLALDVNGYLATLTNPANETHQFAYTVDGLLINRIDPRQHAAAVVYDGLGYLVRDNNPAGGFWELRRSTRPGGYTAMLTSAEGRTTTYRVERLPDGSEQRTNTNPDGSVSELMLGADWTHRGTAPDGTVTTVAGGKDRRFGMTSPVPARLVISTPGGLINTMTRTQQVSLADSVDPLSLTALTETVTVNGKAHVRRYDAPTRTLITTTPEGRRVSMVTDSVGRPLVTQTAGQEPTGYSYDHRGRLITITQGQHPDQRTTVLRYHATGPASGHVARVTDAENRTTSFAYDAAGRIRHETLPGNRTIEYGYDAAGNTEFIIPPEKTAHVFRYTPVNLESGYTPPDLGEGIGATFYTYNLDKQLTQILRPDGRTVDLGYDSGGRLQTLSIPRGLYRYGYHPVTGRLDQVTAPDGGALHLIHDGMLTVGRTWSGWVAGNITWSYDNNFRVDAETINGTDPVTFAYDDDGLLRRSGALSITRREDNGLIETMSLDGVTTRQGSNGFGELTTYSARYDATVLYEVRYERDRLGRITLKTETVEGQTSTYGYDYDVAGRLARVSRDGFNIASYAYDANGNRTAKTTPTGIVSASYDLQDRVERHGNSAFTYSANGELQSKTIAALFSSAPSNTTSAWPSAAITATPLASPPATDSTTPLPAPFGQGSTTPLASPSMANNTVSLPSPSVGDSTNPPPSPSIGDSTTAPPALSAAESTTSLASPSMGNSTTPLPSPSMGEGQGGGETTQYHYDVLGNLITVDLPNGTHISYVIDGRNRRIGKQINGTPVQGFLYRDALNPVAELDGNNNVISRFVYADKPNVPAYMRKDGISYRIISDHLGSPRLVINTDDGSIAQRIDYDEFGNIVSDSNPGFQPFGFAGGLYDHHTKLTRFGARDYDAETGRWTTKDPIRFAGRDTNLYGYALGDPVNFADINGLWSISFGAGGSFQYGAIGGAASSNISLSSNGKVCLQFTTCGNIGWGFFGGLGITGSIAAGELCGGDNSTDGVFYETGSGPGGSGTVNRDQSGNFSGATGLAGVGAGYAGGIQSCSTATYCFN